MNNRRLAWFKFEHIEGGIELLNLREISPNVYTN
jgi:hypothetical protein